MLRQNLGAKKTHNNLLKDNKTLQRKKLSKGYYLQRGSYVSILFVC